MAVLTLIFLGTNMLYHILHKTPRTEETLDLLNKNPEDYVINTIVHNEIIYASTTHYLKPCVEKLSIRVILSKVKPT